MGDNKVNKKLVAAGAGLAVVLFVVVGMASGLLGNSGNNNVSASPTPEASSDSSSSPSASAEPSAEPSSTEASSTPSADPVAPAPAPAAATSSTGKSLPVRTDTLMPAYEEVPVQESVTIEDTVTARLVTMTPTTSDGTAPGEVKGPALAVTIEVTNKSNKPVPLNTAGVTLSLGADLTPASPLPTQSLSKPFVGELAPGQSAQGVYVFLVPSDSAKDIRIEVSYGDNTPLIAFTGTRP